jgi:hypothetical protein
MRNGCRRNGWNERVSRRLFTFSALLSLLLFAAIAVLWVVGLSSKEPSSRHSSPNIYLSRGRITAYVFRGDLTFEVEEGIHTPDDLFRAPPGKLYQGSKISWSFATPVGVFGYSRSLPGRAFQFYVYFPAVLALLLLLLLPALWLFLLLKRRKHSNTLLCVNCRYNLTGNTSGVCPECGTPVPTGANAKA